MNRVRLWLQSFGDDTRLLLVRGLIMGICLVVGGVLFSLGQVFQLQNLIEELELKTYDLRVQLPNTPWSGQNHKPSRDIVILSFDDPTFRVFETTYGTWPWPRTVAAEMTHFLNRLGVRALVFDMMFVGRKVQDPAGDQALIDAFRRYRNVYLSMNLDNDRAITEALGRPLTVDEMDALRPLTLPMSCQLRPGALALGPDGFYDNDMMTFDHVRAILPELLAAGERVGIINHSRDSDGVSRGNPLIYRLQTRALAGREANGAPRWQPVTTYFPYLSLRLAMDLAYGPGARPPMTLTPDGHLKAGLWDIPLSPNGQLLIRWYGPRPYPVLSAWRVLKAMQSGPHHSAEDRELRAFLKDKIIFVGTTAVSTFDLKTTPVNRLMPGVVLQATLFDNLRQNQRYPHRAPPMVNVWLTGGWCIVACWLLIKMRSAIAGLLTAAILGMGYLILAALLFQVFGLWVNMAMPLVALVTVVLLTYSVKYISRNSDYEKTYRLATTDGLTGLYNHRFFQDSMRQLIDQSQRNKSEFSLILVDIDHFKKFNDTFGHQAGDQVLRQVAQTLKASVRNNDIVARYGGEELAILLDRTRHEEATRVAWSLVQAVAAQPLALPDGGAQPITISAGVATYPDEGISPSELIAHADKGLYAAKGNGRNQVGQVTS